MRYRALSTKLLWLFFVVLLASPAAGGELPKNLQDQLASSTFVYISSTRKDGTLSRPAEIWFLWHKGSVYVASPPTTWRVRRIRWGRPQAKIWIGKPDGSSFTATGAVVNEPETYPILLETYARKYPDGWKKWEESFRKGFADGSRVLVRYTPN
ncbi:MAG TPA: hypothetical protein VLF14_02300 [Candidatus Binatia bacterium]|nr:hypothetical protein [Candidatus Binatia bacterium]